MKLDSIAKFIISSVALYSAIVLGTYVGEKYFFDKLFYKKSEKFGYHPGKHNLLSNMNSSVIESRISDLRKIFSTDTSFLSQDINILGSQSDEPFKVVIIGDSFVYGLGVKMDQRFASLLAKKLNLIRPTSVFVLAQEDDGMFENYDKFLRASQVYHPNLYVIGILHNDFIAPTMYKYPDGKILHDQLQASCPGAEFSYTWPKRTITIEQLIEDAFYPSTLPEYQNMCYFNEIVKDMASKNVLFYSFHKEAEKYRESQYSEDQMNAFIIQQYTDVIHQNAGRLVFFDESKYEPVSSKESHPSTQTHQVYAEQLFNEIVENKSYGFTL